MTVIVAVQTIMMVLMRMFSFLHRGAIAGMTMR